MLQWQLYMNLLTLSLPEGVNKSMNPLSPFGWFLIILLVALIIGINLSLFLGQKKKHNPDSWVSRLQKAGTTMRDPFREENKKLDNLAQKVIDLKKDQQKDFFNGDKNE
jgi:hypothetical protein